MNYEDTVWKMNWDYPTLRGFGDLCELHAPNHLFLTIGNGYVWEGGELIDPFQEKDISLNEFLGSVFFTYNLRKEFRNPQKYWDEEKELQKLSDELNTPFKLFRCADKKFSKCFNVPEDVKQDWLEAIINFLETITEMDVSYFVDEEYAAINDYTYNVAHSSKPNCVEQLAYLKEHFKERL